MTTATRLGTMVHEGLWANADFAGGEGINTLVNSDPVAPCGGAAFHDTAVWVRSTDVDPDQH